MATILCKSLHWIPEPQKPSRQEEKKKKVKQEGNEDSSSSSADTDNDNDPASYLEERNESGFFVMHICVFAQSFFYALSPRLAQEGVCEPREIEVFIRAPTFEYCTKVGFTQDCSSELCVATLKKINRFVKSVERWGDVSDPELRRVVLEMCPRLEIWSSTPDMGGTLDPTKELDSHIHFGIQIGKTHPDPSCRASAIFDVVGNLILYGNWLPSSTYLNEIGIVRIVTEGLRKDGLRYPQVLPKYFQSLKTIVSIENEQYRKIFPKDLIPFADFESAFNFVEEIYENGDEKLLRIDSRNLRFILGWFYEFANCSRVTSDPKSYGHPAIVRKCEFIRRYKDSLLPKIFKSSLSKEKGLPTLTAKEDIDIIALVLELMMDVKDDHHYCEEAYPLRWLKDGTLDWYKDSSWENMIKIHRRRLSSDVPLESFINLCERITQRSFYNRDEPEEGKEYFANDQEPFFIISKAAMNIYAGLVQSRTRPLDLLVETFPKEVPLIISTGFVQEHFRLYTLPIPEKIISQDVEDKNQIDQEETENEEEEEEEPEQKQVSSLFILETRVKQFSMFAFLFQADRPANVLPHFFGTNPKFLRLAWLSSMQNQRNKDLGFQGSVLHMCVQIALLHFPELSSMSVEDLEDRLLLKEDENVFEVAATEVPVDLKTYLFHYAFVFFSSTYFKTLIDKLRELSNDPDEGERREEIHQVLASSQVVDEWNTKMKPVLSFIEETGKKIFASGKDERMRPEIRSLFRSVRLMAEEED